MARNGAVWHLARAGAQHVRGGSAGRASSRQGGRTIRALAWRLVVVALLILAALLLPGCAALGYSEVGLYFQHGEDTRKSFALHWNRDQDPRWRYPDCLEPQVGIPTWLCPEVVDNDAQRW